jgi:hypothetical protein
MVATIPTETASAQSRADVFMRRLLRVDRTPPVSAADARKSFQTSILISTVRCLTMYIVFPFVAPALGLATGVGPVVGMVIGTVAMVSIVMSMRRFWRSNHAKRWHYTVLGGAVFVLLAVMFVIDGVALAT